ncbi:MAG: hypothetical protein PHD37_10265 [Gallionellaceae bacterium]|nr:hypothetical protein [Gallionellaceae bacterium]
MLDQIVVVGLAVLLLVSGIYAIPYMSISADWIVYSKRIYYLALMGLLAILALVGKFFSIDRRFSIACGFLALVVMGSAIVRQDMLGEYIYNVLSITFIWLFVHQVVDERFPLDRFLGYLRAGLVVINLMALFVLVRCLLGDQEINDLVASGFNGNRVNFSIWLWQIVFLNYFLTGRQQGGFFLALAISSIVLVLQIYSGGRIGVLASLAVMFYFTLRRLDGAGTKFAVLAYLLVLVWATGHNSPITPKVNEDISIFRELEPDLRSKPIERQWVDEAVEYADGVSAHRVRILINAVGALDAQALLVGKGIGHFDVVADSRTWMVHNVFLKILGELGIGAFLPLLALVWLPFSCKYRGKYDGCGLHFMLLVGIVVGLLQPRFVVTGLSNCLVMWLCYALVLKETRPEAGNSNKAGQMCATVIAH